MTSASRRIDVDVVRGTTPSWLSCERELLADGRPLSLPNRVAWAETQGGDGCAFIAVRTDQRCAFGFAVHEQSTRALPGHRMLRAHRVTIPADPEVVERGVRALADLARSLPRVLRASIETYSTDDARAEIAAAACRSAGFTQLPVAEMQSYEDTILIDLSPSLDSILSGFHATGRRHIRAVDKNPVVLRPIDGDYDDRLNALLQETMSRTGGAFNPTNWRSLMALRDRDPSSCRIVGLFDTRRVPPEDLLAFAVAYNHGDIVEYATAASTRSTDLKMPLAYGVAWDLIAWAHAVGAKSFDFGGVTGGSHATVDPLGGISDFKRYFSKNVVRVGHEWVLEPHPGRAAVARFTTGIASRIRSAI